MTREDHPKSQDDQQKSRSDRTEGRRRGKSMHEGVETWVDTCVCEAEPRWQAEQDRQEEEQRPRDAG